MVRLIGVIVPRRLRRDWRQEWEAELRHREMLLAEWDRLNWRTRIDLLWRSVGAFLDALWLQRLRLEDEMFQDLRYGVRMLIKHRGFTLVAVFSLALGIGANTALFSLVDAVLLKMLPVQDPERLVLFRWEAGRNFRTNGMRGIFVPSAPGRRGASMFRYDTFQRLQPEASGKAESPLSSLFAFASLYDQRVIADDQAETDEVQAVSGGYYDGLGVHPLLGRTITENDDQLNAAPVAVLTHFYWVKRFGGDPGVVGKQIRINNTDVTIIGVTSPEFTGALQVDERPAITVPIALEPTLLGENSCRATAKRQEMWWLHLMGRLKRGATLEQAGDSLKGTFEAHALEVMPPPKSENDVAVLDPRDYPQLMARSGSQGMMENRQTFTASIYGLFIVVLMVLAIACANVANLLLARAALRTHEICLRLAVGASRMRLVRQLLTESVLLGLLGGAVGVLFALWGMKGLMALATRGTELLPTNVDLRLNLRVLCFTLAVSVLTGIVFGVAPAWRTTRSDLNTALKQGRHSVASSSRLSKGLVVAQVVLSLLLLVGAGLFIRTLQNLQSVNLGFNQENLLTFALDLQQGGYKDEKATQFYEQVMERLDNLPGVRAATFARIPLISHYMWNTNILLPGETEKNSGQHITNRQLVRENYFTTLEIPLLAGRVFTPQDVAHSPAVAIVNQTFIKQFFPDESPLGKHVTDPDSKREMEIIGVVADSKYSSQRDDFEPLLYTSWRQESDEGGERYFALRVNGDPTALAGTVREVVHELDPNLPVTGMSTQVARSSQSLAQERLYARLLTFFGGLALALAAIGLSGVLSYSVAQRTSEIGVRMALGAQRHNVLQLVIWQGMKLVIVGLAVGALTGYALLRLATSKYVNLESWRRQIGDQLLYGVKATDPVTFFAIALLLSLIALAACLIPARRAATVDPLQALREE